MFSIHFCVCFYSILYVCESHFTVNNNSPQKDDIKTEGNLDIVKTANEAMLSKNNTTVENLAENVSIIYLSIENISKTVEKNKSIDNVAECLLKKNNSIFKIMLALNDSIDTDKQRIVTEIIVKPENYFDNKTASGEKKKLIESAPDFNVSKKYTVEELNTMVTMDITTEIIQTRNNLTITYKNNVDMTKIFQNYDNITKISQINDNMTTISQMNNNVTKIPHTGDNMTKNSQMNDNGAKIFQKNNDTLKTAEENRFPKDVENTNTTRKPENYDVPKNVQKRDIGIPGQDTEHYNFEDSQKYDSRNNRNDDTYKNIENYDMPKDIQQYKPQNIAEKHKMSKEYHKINKYKPYYHNYEIKYKNIIDKSHMHKKEKHTRFYNDSHKVIPQIQTRLNNDLVKKSFDEFKMVRRKTHYTIPDIQIQNDISKREIDRYQDLNYNPNVLYDEAELKIPKKHVELNYYHKDVPQDIIYPSYQEINNIMYPVYEEVDTMPNNFIELNKVLARQTEIIQKLTKLQTDGRKTNKQQIIALNEAFDKLLNEVEEKKKWRNYTEFSFETTTTTTKLTTTAKPSTILTLFDETEVRLALKNDPHVKRILKLGNLKREKYLKNVKKYLAKNNYTRQNAKMFLEGKLKNSKEVIDSIE